MMNCSRLQNQLLHGDDPRELQREANVNDHLASCAECERLVQQLVDLENAFRAAPLPPESSAARTVFLTQAAAKLAAAQPAAQTAPGRRNLLGRNSYRTLRWITALAVALAIAVGPLLVFEAMRREAVAEPVSTLLALNFDLAETDSSAERERLYASQAPHLAARLAATELPVDVREVAESLLHNAQLLKQHRDALDCAECFNNLADELLARVNLAATRNDSDTVDRLANYYCAIVDRGVNANLERTVALEEIAGAGGSQSSSAAAASQRMRQTEAKMEKRTEQLVSLVNVAPEPAKKGVKRMLDAQKRGPHHRKGSKK